MKCFLCFCFTFVLAFNSSLFAQLIWSNQNSGTTIFGIDNIDFVDENYGYTLMYANKVLSTTNGGTTWSTTTIPGTNLNSISFIDSQTGWLIDYSTAKIYKTITGGSAWFPVYTNPFFSGNAYEVNFVDANFGWATRTDRLLFTTNGGATWDSIPSFGGVNIKFIDQNNGFSNNGNYMYRSTNGGNTWVLNYIWPGPDFINTFCALDASNLWAVGENGLIRRSVDGGITWTTLSYNVYTNLKDVLFYDLYNGIAVGDNGLIITTCDGGLNWVVNISGSIVNLGNVESMGPRLYWVTGASGTILVSNGNDDVVIESYTGLTSVCKNSTEQIPIQIKNNGTTPISSGHFNLTGTMGSILDYDWVGCLAPGSTVLIYLGALVINNTETFTVTFSGDLINTNNSFVFTISELGNDILVSDTQHVCSKDSVEIFASGGAYYEWVGLTSFSDDSTTVITPIASAFYTVNVTDIYGCYSSDSVYVELVSKNFTISDAQLICPNDSVKLYATGGTFYEWTGDSSVSNDSSIIVTPTESRFYTLNIKGMYGCLFTDSVLVELSDTCQTLPNNSNIAISPNGDGVNDFLFLDGIENTSNIVIIYNRWGDKIATIQNYNNVDVFWGGVEKDGTQAYAGTYFFTLEIPVSGSKSSGWVQVIR